MMSGHSGQVAGARYTVARSMEKRHGAELRIGFYPEGHRLLEDCKVPRSGDRGQSVQQREIVLRGCCRGSVWRDEGRAQEGEGSVGSRLRDMEDQLWKGFSRKRSSTVPSWSWPIVELAVRYLQDC